MHDAVMYKAPHMAGTGPMFMKRIALNYPGTLGRSLVAFKKNNDGSWSPYNEEAERYLDTFLHIINNEPDKVVDDSLDETISTGQGGGSAGKGGGQMVGGPTTYEKEYNMFKRKGPRRITAMTNEALDSSYPYEFKNNAYYFITDAGTDYKVMFKGDKKVEVSFMARGENDQPKDDITGTGDSRKVFGTVINIVKDYVGQNQPDILMFAADNSEPSRVRLYNMLASQASKALPGYNFAKAMKGGMFTTFYLTRDGVNVPKLDTAKNLAGRVLDKIV